MGRKRHKFWRRTLCEEEMEDWVPEGPACSGILSPFSRPSHPFSLLGLNISKMAGIDPRKAICDKFIKYFYLPPLVSPDKYIWDCNLVTLQLLLDCSSEYRIAAHYVQSNISVYRTVAIESPPQLQYNSPFVNHQTESKTESKMFQGKNVSYFYLDKNLMIKVNMWLLWLNCLVCLLFLDLHF